ncbi:MAG TPA: hypothetical protein VF379_08290 [Gaiellaceae bacterium]
MVALVAALAVLHGLVTLGPTTPVCRVGVPCTKPAARVVLTFTQGTRVVRVKTDGAGRYRISLRAGAWAVRASTGMRIQPATFRMPVSGSVARNFAIDTGIR